MKVKSKRLNVLSKKILVVNAMFMLAIFILFTFMPQYMQSYDTRPPALVENFAENEIHVKVINVESENLLSTIANSATLVGKNLSLIQPIYNWTTAFIEILTPPPERL